MFFFLVLFLWLRKSISMNSIHINKRIRNDSRTIQSRWSMAPQNLLQQPTKAKKQIAVLFQYVPDIRHISISVRKWTKCIDVTKFGINTVTNGCSAFVRRKEHFRTKLMRFTACLGQSESPLFLVIKTKC